MVITKAKALFQNKMAVRYLAAAVLLAVACILAFAMNHQKQTESIELSGLSVKMPKGISRAEVLEDGGEALLYKGDAVAGGVKLLSVNQYDTDGITIPPRSKQTGEREYQEMGDLQSVSVSFERQYPMNSGKQDSYTEHHYFLMIQDSDTVYDFYEVEAVAKQGIAEYMASNWVPVSPALQPGEGWTKLAVDMAEMEQELRNVETGTLSEYTNSYKISEKVVAEIVGNENDMDAFEKNKDLSALYYCRSGDDTSSFMSARGEHVVFGDFLYILRDNRCIAVRCAPVVKSGATAIWAPVGWREYQPEDIPPMEIVKNGELQDKEYLVYNEFSYQYVMQDGVKTRVPLRKLSHHTELLDAFSEAMFEEKPCTVKLANAYFYDGELTETRNSKLLVYDGKKAFVYQLLKCLDGKYRCYAPEEFVQLYTGIYSNGSGYYDLKRANSNMDKIELFLVYDE